MFSSSMIELAARAATVRAVLTCATKGGKRIWLCAYQKSKTDANHVEYWRAEPPLKYTNIPRLAHARVILLVGVL